MTTQPEPTMPAPEQVSVVAKLIVPSLIGGLVALTLGLYGRRHHPTGIAISIAGFSSLGYVKSWLATVATVFAIVQVISALVLYGKFHRVPPRPWIRTAHRWSGRIAFLTAVPVAMHCLYALGFQAYSTRVLIHSLLGCAFFGAFTVKMLILPKRGLPRWSLPVAGAVVFIVLIAVWFTSAYWFFSTYGIHR
jgi:Na+/serine symporter